MSWRIKKGKITVLPIENLSMIREINILYHSDFKHVDILESIMKEYNKVIKFYTWQIEIYMWLQIL